LECGHAPEVLRLSRTEVAAFCSFVFQLCFLSFSEFVIYEQ
jgi:hypothetical protein